MEDIELVYRVGRAARDLQNIPCASTPWKDFQACCFCGYWLLHAGLAHEVMRDNEE